jgi:hypothetical protein
LKEVPDDFIFGEKLVSEDEDNIALRNGYT